VKRIIVIGRRAIPVPLILGILALVASSYFNTLMSDLIHYLYPDRPIVPDLLFDILPFIPALEFATDPIVIASVIIMLYVALAADRKRAAYYFFAVAAGYVCRGILIILTPLGRPTGNLDRYGIGVFLRIYQHGLFPSGHAYLAAVIYFLIDRAISPRLKTAAGVLCIFEILTALLSHGHYSIDLVGGVMLAYLIYVLMNRHKDRFLAAPPEHRHPSRHSLARYVRDRDGVV
jgi:membrane-associated phospholipid phosphatase